MPIIDSNGSVLSEKEVKQLAQIMKAQFENIKTELRKSDDHDFAEEFCSEYDKRIAVIEKDYLAMMHSKKVVSMDSILSNEVRSTSKQIIDKLVDVDFMIKADANFKNLTEDELDYYRKVSNIFDGTFIEMGDFDIKHIVAPSRPMEEIGPENQADAFEKTVKTFAFAKEPIDGIEDLISYNPNSDSTAVILEKRAGNSTTLKWNAEKVEEEKKNIQANLASGKINQAEFDEEMKKMDDLSKAREESLFSLGSASSLTRVHASELMNKTSVTSFDVFNMFSEINGFVNMNNKDNPTPGTLRGKFVMAGDIYGVGVANVASDMFKTTQMIADSINDIKAEKDPAMQKTHAIQLAAFTYQLTLSEHLFADGNGRSCRMLSDTILQTFGLPPHVPTPEETTIAATIGEPLDYKKGAEVFFAGVKMSSDSLKELRKESPEKTEEAKEKAKGRAHNKIEVTDKLVNDLKAIHKEATRARGTFRDSDEYKKFLTAVDITESLAKAMKDAIEKGTSVNKDLLSPEARKVIDAIKPNQELNLKDASRILTKSFETMQSTAKKYVDYKLEDHTFDKKTEPKKKPLNSDDIAKLKVMKSILGEDLGTGNKVKFPDEIKCVEKQKGGLNI